ncbi:MAG: hypothetical protein KGZ74_01795, partial [Chitinophagaceae bacterium]|nr:hypothetical protein [Chitinophagaceae bacterium]
MKNIRQFFTIIIFIYINSTFSFAQFVTIEGNGFKLNGNKFYPVAVNYNVEAVYKPSDPNVFFASPYHEYGQNGGPN